MVSMQRFPSEACMLLFLFFLSGLTTLKHTRPPQSNLICSFCSSLTLNETDKVKVSCICEFTLIRESLQFVILLHGHDVDRVNAVSCGNATW